MLNIVLALLPVGFILVMSEIVWRKKLVKGERARKFIHVLAGTHMAFWPFYVPFDGIFILGCMALALLIYSRFTHLFHAIYAVRRKTYGDILFAAALIVCAYFGREAWVFTVSILLLAVSDGGAAVVGRLYGIKNQYKVFGMKNLRKSVAGTTAFIVFAYACIGVGMVTGGADVISQHIFLGLVVLPLGAAFIENITPFGLDNLMTPLFATLLLNSLL